jgi:hypothetical protein
MSSDELDVFLGEERTCRVATVGPGGPHVTPLWFLWHGGSLWITSLVRSQRWTDLRRDPRIAVVVDAGDSYGDLRGVEVRGVAEPVGEAPRTGAECPELDGVEQAFADKYTGGTITLDGKHAWLRITPESLASWDFRKVAGISPQDRVSR